MIDFKLPYISYIPYTGAVKLILYFDVLVKYLGRKYSKFCHTLLKYAWKIA